MARGFNGSSDQIAVAAGFNPFGVDFSIAAWVNPAPNNGSAGNKQRTILCSNINSGFNFQLGTGTGTPSIVELDVTNAALVGNSTGTVADGTWSHIGVTWNNTSKAWAFYINGSQSGTGTAAGKSFISSAYTIGLNTNTGAQRYWYGGSIADLFVTSFVLTAGDFAALGSGQRPASLYTGSSNVYAYWPLSGLSSPEPDLSGNARNGTLTGTTLAAGPPTTLFTPKPPILTPLVTTGIAAQVIQSQDYIFSRSVRAVRY